MHVLLATYGPHGEMQSKVRLGVQLEARIAEGWR